MRSGSCPFPESEICGPVRRSRVTCRREPSNLPNPVCPMAKKTTDKKQADKKDSGKKSNARKDDDDSKVRTPSCLGLC